MGEEQRQNSNGIYSQRFCDERHTEVNRRLGNMEDAVRSIKNWLIGVLVMLVMNLVGVIAIFVSNGGG